MTIKWRDEMSVDGAKIDEDHRHLIEIINQFEVESEHFDNVEDVVEILHTLKFYCKTHFTREERLQLLSGYPFYDAHSKEHDSLIDKLDSIIDEIRDCDVRVIKKIAAETAELLKHWLIDHVLQSDLRMKPYVKEMEMTMKDMGKLSNIKP